MAGLWDYHYPAIFFLPIYIINPLKNRLQYGNIGF